MIPTIALVGRPNVGKSTLFNNLTRSRDALVANVPGLTRDRRYGRFEVDGQEINVIDTGGLFGEHALKEVLHDQTNLAIHEADLVLLMLDGRDGPNPHDHDIVRYLRKESVRFQTVINKVDGLDADQVVADFAIMGLGEPIMISAAHNRGIATLKLDVVALIADLNLDLTDPLADLPGIKVAVVGRPNVGKSTLVNRLIGEDRQVVFDMPGTTKDAIDIPFSREGVDYVMIDTAGVRRKGKVYEITEKFSVVKALDAMARAEVVILVVDAQEGVVEQDLHVLQYALDAGCAMVVAINKIDGLDEDQRDVTQHTVDRRLSFVPWVPLKRISALHGTGVGHLFDKVNKIYEAGLFEVTTSLLTRLVRNLVDAHPAPSVRGRQIKIKMASRASNHPPTVTIHGNQLRSLPDSYKRYLENGIREALDLLGNPVKINFKEAANPFAHKRNELTEKQRANRGRVIKHRKLRKKKK
ncbi:MAG: GTP-binding protein [Limisphaerales bacterium]|jgi:GTP-binding protein